MKKISLVVCYWGKWPKWFPFFLQSCCKNHHIDWIFFTDHPLKENQSKNLKFIPFLKEDFNQLATKKMGFRIYLDDPYKLCDFKPAYGKIFEDYLKGYEYWGYSDIDIIYGRTNKFFGNKFLKYDVISTYKNYCSGPCCLFKNIPEYNQLFTQVFNYYEILSDPKHYGMDENIRRDNSKLFKRIIVLIEYSILNLNKFPFRPGHFTEFRYQFQWFFKLKTIREDILNDMSEVLYSNQKKKKVKVWFSGFMQSDKYFERISRRKWKLKWDNGILIDPDTGKELFGFHFIQNKHSDNFTIPELSQTTKLFYITQSGIFHE